MSLNSGSKTYLFKSFASWNDQNPCPVGFMVILAKKEKCFKVLVRMQNLREKQKKKKVVAVSSSDRQTIRFFSLPHLAIFVVDCVLWGEFTSAYYKLITTLITTQSFDRHCWLLIDVTWLLLNKWVTNNSPNRKPQNKRQIGVYRWYPHLYDNSKHTCLASRSL